MSGHDCADRCALIHALALAEPAWTLEQIGEELGLTRERIRQVLGDHGWEKPRLTSKGQMIHGGQRCPTCGERFYAGDGRSLEALALVRRHNATHDNPRRIKWDQHALVVALYLADFRIVDIIAETGVSFRGIYDAILRAGLQPNRGGGRYERAYDPDIGRTRRKQDVPA